ncbi:MAG: KpsF/GutQ family sugar-phosphate isomerase [Deltaproteobacteria bacterium]
MPARPRLARTRPRRSGRPIDLRRASFVSRARTVLTAEADAVRGLIARVGDELAEAVDLILACPGRVVVTGMGKSGFIAQKLSATFASTGTPSLYLHPAEALHGDLGRVVRDDIVFALSNSGATDELLRLVPAVRRIGARVIAMTGDVRSPLARSADLILDIGPVDEACPLGLAPTASTLALLAMGDALAMTVLENREFGSDEYALLHPGGSLGQSVRRVAEVMRTGAANPVVSEQAPLSKAISVMTRTPGRPGATSVVDRRGKLVGIFTDGDLRRLVEDGQGDFTVPVGSVCGHQPRTVRPEQLVRDAADLLKTSRVDQLPVIDEDGRPVGLLDVQDVLGLRF